MSNIITHEANGGTFLLVGIAPGDHEFRMIHDSQRLLWLNAGGHIRRTGTSPRPELPPGQYEIMGVADQLSEEQCFSIVRRVPKWYRDYDGSDPSIPFNRESVRFLSLLRSHSFTPSTCLVLRKK